MALEGNCRIDQHHHDIREFDRTDRVCRRKLLEFVLNIGPLAQARSIEDFHAAAVPGEVDADGISRDAGLGSRQQPLFAENAIDERRLAGIGPPDNSETQRLRRIELAAVLFFAEFRLLCSFSLYFSRRRGQIRQRCDEGLVEIARAFAMFGGNRDGIA